jgi:DNA-binding PadR family transcriptional regulator
MTNTELAVLGLVAESPRYGYQIDQLMEQRGMREWTEVAFSSIYYVLNKLEADDWLSSETRVEADRPARKVYRLTPLGEVAYREAVRARLAAPRPRSGDFTLALANLPALPPLEQLAALEIHRDTLRARLEDVRQKQRQDGAEQLPHPAAALFDYSLTLMQSELAWLEKFIHSLRASL